jgi:hypothetical protein
LPTGLPLTRRLPSIPSAAVRTALFEDFLGTTHLSDFSCPFIVGYSLFGLPDADRRAGRPPGRTGDLPGSDAILSCVMWSSTTAERRPLAYRCRTCCLRRCLPSRPLRISSFRGSIAHPAESLCTLRARRRRRPRNTRYRAPATAYPCRSSTGWIAPASPGAQAISVQRADRDCFATLAMMGWMAPSRHRCAKVGFQTTPTDGSHP